MTEDGRSCRITKENIEQKIDLQLLSILPYKKLNKTPKTIYKDIFNCKYEKDKVIGIAKGNIGPSRPYMFDITQPKRKPKKKIARSFLGKKVLISKKEINSNQNLKYKDFEPMNKIWQEYFASMFDHLSNIVLSSRKIMISAGNKLLKLDYHGAVMYVLECSHKNLVGLKGIMIQETCQIFTLISEDNKIRFIPKHNGVFGLIYKELLVKIYGDQFRFRSGTRYTRTIKVSTTVNHYKE